MAITQIQGRRQLFESGITIKRCRRSPSAEARVVGKARDGGFGGLPHENFVIKDD